MRFWRKVPGALKDRRSLLLANLAKRTTLRNPDIEKAVIRATSHDPTFFDHKTANKIYGWICLSPACLRPFVWSLCVRLDKTRSWVVVLKGLILMHGLFNCRVPSIHKVGRLPFDLGAFNDGHKGPINAFIRDYFTFLDQKSAFMAMDCDEQQSSSGGSEKEEQEGEKLSIKEDLVNIQKLQILLDLLLRIEPQDDMLFRPIIGEATNCVLMEIFGIYSTICRCISNLFVKIYLVDKAEATMALKVLKKGNAQAEELSEYCGFYTRLGLLKPSDCPKMELVSEEDLHEIEQVIHIVAGEYKYFLYEDANMTNVERKRRHNAGDQKDLEGGSRTMITNKWEPFDEDKVQLSSCRKSGKTAVKEESKIDPDKHQHFPDLIKF